MSKITKKQFLADVMHEIEMLKKHATPEEIGRLDFGKFDPKIVYGCIYGQMTHNCSSPRAHALMDMSCIRQMNLPSGAWNLSDMVFTKVVDMINGPYDKRTWSTSRRNWSYLSALEGYINLKGAKNKEIIAYLKGEIPTLTP